MPLLRRHRRVRLRRGLLRRRQAPRHGPRLQGRPERSGHGCLPRTGCAAAAAGEEVDCAEEQEKTAGVVSDPVATRMEGSAWWSSHSMVGLEMATLDPVRKEAMIKKMYLI